MSITKGSTQYVSLSPADYRASVNSSWETYERQRIKELQQEASGNKNDQEKSRVDLIDPEFLEGLGHALKFGANKYDSHNWRGGIKFSRLFGAILRHTLALLRGEDNDIESGLGHVYHLACSVMFLSWHLKHRQDLDDRYKY